MTRKGSESLFSRLKIGLAIGALRVLTFCLALLPTSFVLSVFSALGYIASFLFEREMDIGVRQLRRAFEGCLPNTEVKASTAQYRRFMRQVFSHFGEFVGEVLLYKKIFEEKQGGGSGFVRIEEVDAERISKLAEEQNAAVVLSGHLGQFELSLEYQRRLGRDINAIGRDANSEVLDAVLKDSRKIYGEAIIWREDKGAVAKILRLLKQGRMLGALIDQDTRVENGFAPFFGLDAAHPITPIQIAVKYKLPVLSTFFIRTSRLSYRVVNFEIPYEAEDEDAATHVLREYSRQLEDLVREYPEQWPWWHRRWRRRPGVDYSKTPEELRSTKQYLAWLEK